MPKKYISIFSGIEAASVAWQSLGWKPVAFSEIDTFPSAVLAQRFPDVPNLGDIREVDWSEYKGNVDLVVGGSPCFVAGTLVLCESGFKPIEQVQVGERVVTHIGRLRKVLKTGSKIADTIVLRGIGSDGIECTPNHPFYSREKSNELSKWREARDMKDKYWLNIRHIEHAPIPRIQPYEISNRFNYDLFFYKLGLWLATALVESNEQARSRYGSQFGDWASSNFGSCADDLAIPTWCFGMGVHERNKMYEGYCDVVDRCPTQPTMNRKLALGIKMLAESLGHCGTSCESQSEDAYYFADRGFYGLVKEINEGHKNVRVYNLEVEGDNSYTADGIAVHNCQSFSIAGNREGLDGESRLMFEYIRCVQDVRPEWFLWENVPGVHSTDKGRAFGTLLAEMEKLGYLCSWRVLDAQFFGVAQRRNRVFLVGHTGKGGQEYLQPYCLSAKACQGILRRAARKGKSLPEPLVTALQQVAQEEPTNL